MEFRVNRSRLCRAERGYFGKKKKSHARDSISGHMRERGEGKADQTPRDLVNKILHLLNRKWHAWPFRVKQRWQFGVWTALPVFLKVILPGGKGLLSVGIVIKKVTNSFSALKALPFHFPLWRRRCGAVRALEDHRPRPLSYAHLTS